MSYRSAPTGSEGLPDEACAGALRAIIGGNGHPMIGEVEREIAPHDAEPDEADAPARRHPPASSPCSLRAPGRAEIRWSVIYMK